MLLEAVPNLSLGPESDVLAGLVEELEAQASPGWALLDIHADPDHNRSVLTMAGAPAPLVERLRGMIGHLVDRGSLVGHEGVHPRIGLVDVVPVVPLADARTGDAIRAARQVADHLGRRGVPVYGYGALASRPEHRVLAGIRRAVRWQGKTEQLPVEPDDGPLRFHPTVGAACVGVRGPLVAYNVVLDTDDLGIGRAIARALRSPGEGLEGVQALAFPLASRGGRVQVSTNLTDLDAARPEDVFGFVRHRAEEHGVAVLEGELVGLAPEAALPADPGAIGLDAGPRSLEERLRETGLPAGLS